MNAFLLLQQMLILFGMMMTGYLACKAGWADKTSGQKLSSLIVHILNPALMISSLWGKEISGSGKILVQNLAVVLLYFVFVIFCGFLYCAVFRPEKTKASRIKLLTAFSNVGFMGIPIVRALYGAEYVIFIVVYILIFNVLVYTYGVYLCLGMTTEKKEFSLKKIFNIGTVSCMISILLFVLQVPVSTPVLSFFTYLGDAVIPLSMIVIGISMAQADMKELLKTKENYGFLLFKMLLVPASGVLLFRLLPLDRYVYLVFSLIVSMPCASISGMMAQEYAGNGDECNKMVLLTTVVSVVTIPLISLI